MKFKYRNIIFWSFFLLLSLSLYAQPGDLPPYQEPGKCYAKALMPALYESYEIEIPVYFGDDQNILDKYVKDTVIITRETTMGWVKKKKDKICHSPDPDDCLVWCREKIDAIVVEVTGFLSDTSVSEEYEMEYLEIEKLVEKEHTDWREVICENKLSKKILKQLRDAIGMVDYNYNIGLDKKTKSELRKYQITNGLPAGNLNIETLEHLGIPIW